jgi:hypothetical protein
MPSIGGLYHRKHKTDKILARQNTTTPSGELLFNSQVSTEGFPIDRMTITTVGVVTRDRLPSLVGCLESYLENCQRHARIPEFVVTDDSPGTEAADRTRAALRKLAHRFNARVRYGGRREKSRFAAALAAESKVAGKIIYFLLFGDERCTRSTGANRNCLLLDTVGTLILTVDDDTLCRTAAVPERETSPSFFSGYDPTAFWFFADRARAIQAVSSVDADVLALHEPLLGSAVADLGVPAESSGRVAMTLHGLVGDSGMGSPLLLPHPGRRVTRPPGGFTAGLSVGL